jgi:RNA polymerase sigma-70 factor (ECF subfamily)
MIGGMNQDAPVAGPARSVELLFAHNERRLGVFLVQMVRDRALAEDLLQETFVEAYRHPDRLAGAADPDALLFGIARNRALAALRRARRFRLALTRLAAAATAEVGSDSTHREILDVLDRTLGPQDRALVVLRYLHGFDAPALAEMTGRSPAAVRKRLERACVRLAEVIER